MILEFDKALVLLLVTHAKSSTKHSEGYEKKPGPGLFLVGDQGVYLMSCGEPGLMHPDAKPGETKHFVVYAKGIDPNVDDFDSWWEAKRASFGGDDGAEKFPLAQIEGWLSTYADREDVTHISMNISATRMELLGPPARKPARRPTRVTEPKPKAAQSRKGARS